jgi:hypothetical protein
MNMPSAGEGQIDYVENLRDIAKYLFILWKTQGGCPQSGDTYVLRVGTLLKKGLKKEKKAWKMSLGGSENREHNQPPRTAGLVTTCR